MFIDRSSQIAFNPAGLYYGVAVADLDGDGQNEFFVCGYSGPNRVLKWSGNSLQDIAPPVLADPTRQAIGVAAADLDGDGREELYVLNTDTFAGPKQRADRLFDAQADGRWTDLFQASRNKPVRNLIAGRSVAVLDRRGTGRYGFFVANYGRPMRYYEADPEGKLVDLAPSLGLNVTTGGRGLWTGPLLSPRMDIFCVNEHGENFLFINDGDGHFTEIAGLCGLHDPQEHGRGVVAFDADDDGRLDLCWGNWEGPNRLMIRQPDNTFRDQATPALAFPGQVRTVIAADFDNDGYEELFFHCIGEPNRLFARAEPDRNHWKLQDPGAALEAEGCGTGAAVADIDGDGRLELLLAHGESRAQPLSFYSSPVNNHAWIRIQPRTQYGAPARGALIRLQANGRTQVRVIDAGSGYLCQMEPVAHFGLGPNPQIESASIQWPDGSFLTVQDLTPGTTVVIDYPSS